jgi:hypothetical protein
MAFLGLTDIPDGSRSFIPGDSAEGSALLAKMKGAIGPIQKNHTTAIRAAH